MQIDTGTIMQKKPTAFSPYAPIRKRDEILWRMARDFGKDGLVTSDGRVGSNFYQTLDEYYIQPAGRAMFVMVKEDPDSAKALGMVIAKITSSNDWVPLIAQYELCGRQIFDFNDRLTELLVETDLGECTLENLHLPYDGFFIRFGKLESVKLPFEDDFEYVDGAFIGWAPWDENGSRLKIGFSTIHPDGSNVDYPGCYFDILPDELVMPVPLAIETALQRRLLKYRDEPNSDLNALAINAHYRAEIEDSYTVLKAGASLIINSLFYLESIRSELPDVSPGRDTPPELQAKYLNATGHKKLKHRSSLTVDGYALVRLVGQEVDNPNRDGVGTSTKKVHWRRGHWRFQAYGVKSSLRKRIWIKPTLIGGEHGTNEDIPGHIYVVGSTNKTQ